MHEKALYFLKWINNDLFAVPATVLFLGAALFLTLKTGFIQIRALPRFFSLIFSGVKNQKEGGLQKSDTISPFHALFTALGTSIGMGNVVGPTIAIMTGGPGALFWLLFYMFFASVTKFTEVVFAMHTRIKTADGIIIGGPMEYLKAVHPAFAWTYCAIMTWLFAGFSSAQSNTLASIYAIEGIPCWVIGFALAAFVAVALSGGAQRVGAIASKLVPVMFVLYVSFALFIIFRDMSALKEALSLIWQGVFNPKATIGGFMGATFFQSIHAGVFRGVYISESGLGTASIPHAMSDAKRHVDQGILAMGSTIADMMLSTLSGLLVLTTGFWTQRVHGNTAIYELFKVHSPLLGQIVLLIAVTLFVLTTVVGNSFNGVKSFTALSGSRFMFAYLSFIVVSIFLGALMPVPLVWEMVDTLLALAALPNLIGLLILAIRYPKILKLHQEY